MIIEVNPNNSTDLYSLASQKQQVLQSHVLTIPSTGWTEDLTTHIWSYTANFSPDFGAEIGLFDNPNLIASYTIPQGDMSNYNKCASCNVRVASIVLPTPGASNYGAKVVADLQPDINISLDFIIYGKNDSVGDKASDSVSQYIIEHCIAQYQPSFAYAVGNMCYQDGVIYKCIANTTGHIPPNNTYWVRFDKDLQDRVLTLEQNYATLSISDTITKTNLGSFTIDGTKLIKFANGAPSQSTSSIGNVTTPVFVNSGVVSVCNSMVTIDTTQSITGHKVFVQSSTTGVPIEAIRRGNGAGVSITQSDQSMSTAGIQYYPGMFVYDGGDERVSGWYPVKETDGHSTFRIRVRTSDGTTREAKVDLDMDNSANASQIPTMAYLNSETKATYLVHRAGTETITGSKTFGGQVNINGVYKNKSAVAIITSNQKLRWTRLYHTGEYTDLTNQVLLFLITGQKGNSNNISGILNMYFSRTNVTVMDLTGHIYSENYNRLCAVRCTDGRYEIWAYAMDENHGIYMQKLVENNWGYPANYWVVDGATYQATFDPTDTSKYTAYSYIRSY